MSARRRQDGYPLKWEFEKFGMAHVPAPMALANVIYPVFIC